jgi:hypothetical protein
LRSHDNWFLLKPTHEKTDVDRVVRDRGGYLVVEKDRLPG